MPSIAKASALLLAATSTVDAKPSEYWKRTTDVVKSQRDAIRTMRVQKSFGDKDPEKWGEFQASELDGTAWNRPDQGLNAIVPPLTAETNVAEWCGNEANGQRQWFAENRCSKASADMTYFDTQNNIREAKKGEVINMGCDSVLCPTPKVPDCYLTPGICTSDEWCMLNQQEVWDAVGAGGGNTIAQVDFCKAFFNSSEWSTSSAADYHKMLQTNVAKKMSNVDLETATKLFNSAADRCGGTDGMAYGVTYTNEVDYMKGARGRCVKYRQEGQSCVPQFADFVDSSTKSLLPKMENGKQFLRPLLCAKGLQCTGGDFDVMPSTCVAERPKDVCFLGTWWDSTVCPRSETKVKGGLDYETTLTTIRTFLLLFPGDVVGASVCSYWDKSTTLGQATYDARVDGYAIVSALWPAHLGGKFASPGLPSFEQFEKGFVLPGVSRKACDDGSKDKDSRIAFLLAVNHIRTERANNIWSFIHFMMHNQPNNNPRLIAASRELAHHLMQRFWCTNCRNYFTAIVEDTVGLPPNSNNPVDHAKFWNLGHSLATEHVATTRGDDPWIYQIGEESVASMQNPFYISFERAEEMWKYDATEKELGAAEGEGAQKVTVGMELSGVTETEMTGEAGANKRAAVATGLASTLCDVKLTKVGSKVIGTPKLGSGLARALADGLKVEAEVTASSEADMAAVNERVSRIDPAQLTTAISAAATKLGLADFKPGVSEVRALTPAPVDEHAGHDHNNNKTNDNQGAIIGGAVGAMAALLLLGAACGSWGSNAPKTKTGSNPVPQEQVEGQLA